MERALMERRAARRGASMERWRGGPPRAPAQTPQRRSGAVWHTAARARVHARTVAALLLVPVPVLVLVLATRCW